MFELKLQQFHRNYHCFEFANSGTSPVSEIVVTWSNVIHDAGVLSKVLPKKYEGNKKGNTPNISLIIQNQLETKDRALVVDLNEFNTFYRHQTYSADIINYIILRGQMIIFHVLCFFIVALTSWRAESFFLYSVQ